MLRICSTLFLCFVCLFSHSQDTISRADIAAAARLSGLLFSAPEIDSMYGDIKNSHDEYVSMHRYALPNSVPMSLVQNPVLPGMRFNTVQQPIDWHIPTTAALPANVMTSHFILYCNLLRLSKTKR